MAETPKIGLRERKKLQTRRDLSFAALRLVVQRGYDNVLVEDIAADAEVSPRTFNNYFSSKAEAIAAHHLDRVRRIADQLRERPADEPLWDAVTHAIVAEFPEPGPEPAGWRSGVLRMLEEPAVQGAFLRAGAVAEREYAVVIAERTGTDPDHDLYPQLVAAVIGAATDVVMTRSLRADPPTPLLPLIREAIALLAAGLPAPE